MKRRSGKFGPAGAVAAWRAAVLVAVATLVSFTDATVAGDVPFPGVIEHWAVPAAERHTYQKFLVVGISREEARRRFEDRFVSLLRGRSSAGITSYSIVPNFDQAEETAVIVDKLMTQKVDAVITVRLVPMDGRSEEDWRAAWHADVAEPVRARAYVEDSLKRMIDPDTETYGVEASLFDLESGRRVWASRSGPMKMKDLREQATPIVKALIDELRYQHLL